MKFNILTLFPGMFTGPVRESIIGRARERGIIDINVIDIRDFTNDKHRTTDDYPYGGGAGMVMKFEPIYRAREDIMVRSEDKPHTILFTPQGRKLNQNIVNKYSNSKNLILLCGHYEGVDERIRQALVDDELSIGDYVLTGGELPAMVFIDAVSRLLPGVLGDERSLEDDSFYQGILSYPQYTRPREFKGHTVPEVLLSGNHQKIRLWRKKQALKRTLERRPDLLKDRQLTSEEKDLLLEIKQEMERG